jgi:aminobenzoyl-glutamate transport protein
LGAFYGIIAGAFNTLADVYDAVLYGIRQGAPFLLFYVLLTELYQSLLFIMGV